MTEKEVLFYDEETKGKVVKKGRQIMTIYPKIDHTKCPIYQRSFSCINDNCSLSCNYYKFYLKVQDFFEQRNQVLKRKKTLDYYFTKGVEIEG
ncbi:MAG: hypothetical protein ACTSPO_15175 [Candidatus Heimdallarchaeaceae archaeon]